MYPDLTIPNTTWADGFDCFYAAVPLTGTEDERRDAARALIREQLALRGVHWEPRITLAEVTAATAIYKEF